MSVMEKTDKLAILIHPKRSAKRAREMLHFFDSADWAMSASQGVQDSKQPNVIHPLESNEVIERQIDREKNIGQSPLCTT